MAQSTGRDPSKGRGHSRVKGSWSDGSPVIPVRVPDSAEIDVLHMGGIAGDVARFNAATPVGSPVLFWPGDRSGEGRESVTRSRAWLLGDQTPVVMVEDYPGGIALTHVAPIPPIASESGA